MSDEVLYDASDGVATITLNRPDALNAFDAAMKAGLKEALATAAEDATVRAVVITGAGRAFCVGQDLRELEPLYAGTGDPRLGDTVTDDYNPIVLAITTMEKPVVAAVNGIAAGAGASLAFACDFRIAADNVAFHMAFPKIGLVPDSGASWTLQRLVGYARAMEMLLLGDPVPAARALEIGLVNRVVPAAELGASVAELAGRLAVGPTRGYALTKRVVSAAATSDLPTALELEGKLQAEAGRTADHVNAARAFLAKEQPTFRGE